MARRTRIVLGHRNPESLRADGRIWALRQNGDYEVVPNGVDPTDHDALRRHFDVDEVVVASQLDTSGVRFVDGPLAGGSGYTIRTSGSQHWGSITVRNGTYHVIDHAASELEAEFRADESSERDRQH